MAMHRFYPTTNDFETSIRILAQTEGGRRTSPFNGIRWDFSYAEDDCNDQLYMIWPDFYSATGDSLPADQTLPLGVELPARMMVVVDEMRASVHRKRIEVGTCFYCHEGPRRVAVGRVTRITGLHLLRTKHR